MNKISVLILKSSENKLGYMYKAHGVVVKDSKGYVVIKDHLFHHPRRISSLEEIMLNLSDGSNLLVIEFEPKNYTSYKYDRLEEYQKFIKSESKKESDKK